MEKKRAENVQWISATVPVWEHERLGRVAYRNGVSMAEIIRQAVKEYLDRLEPGLKKKAEISCRMPDRMRKEELGMSEQDVPACGKCANLSSENVCRIQGKKVRSNWKCEQFKIRLADHYVRNIWDEWEERMRNEKRGRKRS